MADTSAEAESRPSRLHVRRIIRPLLPTRMQADEERAESHGYPGAVEAPRARSQVVRPPLRLLSSSAPPGTARPGEVLDVRPPKRAAAPEKKEAMRAGGATRTQVCEAFAALLRAAETDDDAPRRIAARMRLPAGTLAPDACAAGTQAALCAAVEALAQRVATGHDVRLLCWCYPCACHGERIAEAVRSRARELQRRGKRRR